MYEKCFTVHTQYCKNTQNFHRTNVENLFDIYLKFELFLIDMTSNEDNHDVLSLILILLVIVFFGDPIK